MSHKLILEALEALSAMSALEESSKFKDTMKKTKKVEDFLDKNGLVLTGGGVNGKHLVTKKGAKETDFHVGTVTREFIQSIDINKPLNKSQFDFIK